MNIAFTLCSNNYLAQAKTLGDSFIKHHPDFEFIIGLVDDYNDTIDYNVFKNFTILAATEIEIPDYHKLEQQFNIIELNTAVKPFYFTHIFKSRNADKIIYLDPDILIFSRFSEVISLLDNFNIIITPQLCSPVDDGHSPIDQDLLATGTFNLGFIALSKFQLVADFISWWSERIVKYGYGKPDSHMFYDQLLINLVPAYFGNYHIIRHLGYNMAGWNLYERIITDYNDSVTMINGSDELRFFHFSGYKFNKPDVITNYNNRFSFETRPDVKEVYNLYHKSVMSNNYDNLSKVVPIYTMKKEEVITYTIPEKVVLRLKRTAKVFLGLE